VEPFNLKPALKARRGSKSAPIVIYIKEKLVAYPGENEHTDYLKYIEEWSLGERRGKKMNKEEWRQKRKPKKKMESLLGGRSYG
jgi:hypothetical protein